MLITTYAIVINAICLKIKKGYIVSYSILIKSAYESQTKHTIKKSFLNRTFQTNAAKTVSTNKKIVASRLL